MTTEPTTGPQTPERYAFVPDGVWDGVADARSDGRAVVVDGRRIEAVVPVAELPEGLPRVDLPGATLLPGFIDAHTHYSSVMGPRFSQPASRPYVTRATTSTGYSANGG